MTTANEAPTFDVAALRSDLSGGGSIPVIWGERIFTRRRQLNLTKAQLARMTGTGRQNIKRFETGENAPRLYMQYAIAKALDAQMHDLFPLPPVNEIESRYPVMDLAVAS